MEQRDYLLREINQLGKVLGKMIAGLLRLKQGDVAMQGVEVVNQSLKSEIDLDLDLLMTVEPDRLIGFLIKDKGFNEDNLDKLAEILFMIAGDMTEDNPVRNSYYERCLVIYEYLDKTQQIYSFDRYLKLEQIKTNLQ